MAEKIKVRNDRTFRSPYEGGALVLVTAGTVPIQRLSTLPSGLYSKFVMITSCFNMLVGGG
jgi:hypothetical protein